MTYPKKIYSVLLVVLAVAVFVKLGFWQLERLHWKQGLIATMDIEKAIDATQVPLIGFINTSEANLKRGYLAGVWLRGKNVKVGPQMSDEGLGYWIISPLMLNDGTAILVNRGWVPEGLAAAALDADLPKGVVRLTGALRQSDTRGQMVGRDVKSWHGLQVERIAQGLELQKFAPLALFMESSVPADNVLLKPAQAFTNLRNEHLNYAIFWFGMALLTLVLAGFANLPKRR